MYTSYFGFREKPFNITPDPRFFFGSPIYSEVYSNLTYTVRERKGFAALTGQVGTGKTTLLRKLMDDLGATARFVYFYNTNLNFEELLTFICEELNLRVDSNDGRLGKIRTLNEFLLEQLRRDGTGVLLIDEAQNLGSDVLENLRLLSNLETGREKLLQIVLAGQPEFEKKLDHPELRQLKQRISIHCRLSCLKEREVGSFIAHRLMAVGSKRNDLFVPEALRKIALYSKGVPRLINIVCDNALLIAYATSQKTISPGIIDEVVQDLRLASDIGITGLAVASATAAQHHRIEGRLHATAANSGPRETSMRQLDGQRHIIALRADAEKGLEQKSTTVDVIPTEKAVLQICEDDENRNKPFTLTREELKVAAKIDGFRDVQTIAESLPASYASVMIAARRMHRLGIVKVVSSEGSSDMVPPSFFDIMMSVLTDAVGPMARIILQEQLKAFGKDPTAFPKALLMRLVGAVSREILQDQVRTEFEGRMFQVICAL